MKLAWAHANFVLKVGSRYRQSFIEVIQMPGRGRFRTFMFLKYAAIQLIIW